MDEQPKRLRINCSLEGEAAEVLLALKKRKIVGSNRDALVQAILTFNEKIIERDLKQTQLKNLGEISKDE